jgi:Cu/Ag efflux pump CusA
MGLDKGSDGDRRGIRARLGAIIGFAAMLGSAALVALVLVHLAHDDIGLTRQTIRHSALIAGAIIAMFCMV